MSVLKTPGLDAHKQGYATLSLTRIHIHRADGMILFTAPCFLFTVPVEIIFDILLEISHLSLSFSLETARV
jgi:hypothetical protein